LKKLHGQIAYEIPQGFRICGENLYAEHSLHYNHLKSFFEVFFIWNENNIALSWDETVEWCELLGLEHVPIIYRGIWDKDIVHETYTKYKISAPDPVEGYVIRTVGRISYKDYRRSTAKWVRKGHVQTSEFWMNQPVIPNELE
jgi:hypothetical protein